MPHIFNMARVSIYVLMEIIVGPSFIVSASIGLLSFMAVSLSTPTSSAMITSHKPLHPHPLPHRLLLFCILLQLLLLLLLPIFLLSLDFTRPILIFLIMDPFSCNFVNVILPSSYSNPPFWHSISKNSLLTLSFRESLVSKHNWWVAVGRRRMVTRLIIVAPPFSKLGTGTI